MQAKAGHGMVGLQCNDSLLCKHADLMHALHILLGHMDIPYLQPSLSQRLQKLDHVLLQMNERLQSPEAMLTVGHTHQKACSSAETAAVSHLLSFQQVHVNAVFHCIAWKLML